MRAARKRFWLSVTDVIVACGGYGTRAYYWALRHAAALEEWGGYDA